MAKKITKSYADSNDQSANKTLGKSAGNTLCCNSLETGFSVIGDNRKGLE